MWVIEIKYFEFYCKFYYLYEHLELKKILSTKYLNNLQQFTTNEKMRKKNNEKCMKLMSEKIFFGVTLNRIQSYHPEHKLVCYEFLKNLFLWCA